jgi:hypothetical protein
MNSFLINVYPPNEFLFGFENKRIMLNSFGLIKKNEGGLKNFLKTYNPKSYETKISFNVSVKKQDASNPSKKNENVNSTPNPLDIYAMATQQANFK